MYFELPNFTKGKADEDFKEGYKKHLRYNGISEEEAQFRAYGHAAEPEPKPTGE